MMLVLITRPPLATEWRLLVHACFLKYPLRASHRHISRSRTRIHAYAMPAAVAACKQVLLHDPNSLFAFEDNVVCVPICVCSDLDRMKLKPGDIGANARQVWFNDVAGLQLHTVHTELILLGYLWKVRQVGDKCRRGSLTLAVGTI